VELSGRFTDARYVELSGRFTDARLLIGTACTATSTKEEKATVMTLMSRMIELSDLKIEM
jgi:hypothetical protein